MDEIPQLLVVRPEIMWSVRVYPYAVRVEAVVHIAADMLTAIHHQNRFAAIGQGPGDHASGQSGADDQVVGVHHTDAPSRTADDLTPAIISPARKARATMVRPVFTAPAVGRTEPSTTYKPSIP